MSRAQLCILNGIFDEYLKYDVKKQRTQIEPLITHSWSNIEGLSTIRNTCDPMSGTANRRGAGDDDSFYTDTPLSDSKSSQCIGGISAVIHTDWGLLKRYLYLHNFKLKVGLISHFSHPLGVSVRVWGCEVGKYLWRYYTERGRCHQRGGGGGPVTGVRTGTGMCLFRIVAPELTHRLYVSIIFLCDGS